MIVGTKTDRLSYHALVDSREYVAVLLAELVDQGHLPCCKIGQTELFSHARDKKQINALFVNKMASINISTTDNRVIFGCKYWPKTKQRKKRDLHAQTVLRGKGHRSL